MRKLLPLLFYGVIICMGLCGNKAFSQINYSANFNTGTNNWQSETFLHTDEGACTGAGALSANLWYYEPVAEVISPAVGTSNGAGVTLSYSYKILNFDYPPTEPTQNEDNWGSVNVYYGTTATGPWNLIQTINPENHTELATCQQKTVTFTPPAGSPVYLRILAESENEDADYLVYIDQVSVNEASGCNGAPPASSALAALPLVCNTQNTVLSLSPAYTTSGLTFKWQTSPDGITYTNVATGGTAQNYSVLQAATTWYRAVITCTASGISTVSAPVQVQSTGLPCYCTTINFEYGIEPITYVGFAGISQASTDVISLAPSLQNFTAVPAAQVNSGQTYPLIVKGNTDGDFENFFTAYIDFNHNGSFNDEGEAFEAGMIEGSAGTDDIQATSQITIPVSAMAGLTRMRIIKNFGEPATDPCGTYDYGQAEDYLVNITAVPVCETAPAVAQVTATGAVVCAGQGTTLSLSTAYTAGETFQWQISYDGVNFDNVPGAVSNTYYTTPQYSVYYRAVITCAEGNLSVTTLPKLLTVQNTPVPALGLAPQFCHSAVAADLAQTVTGQNIVWYTNANGTQVLAQGAVLTNGTTYYATQTINGCESQRLAVTVHITVVPNPVIPSPQYIDNPFATVADIEVNGVQNATINFYLTAEDAANAVNALPQDTPLITQPTTYYAVQSINGCNSEVVAVIVDIPVMAVQNESIAKLEFYPNPVSDVLNISYSNVINTIEVYNITGQRILERAINNNTTVMDFSGLAAGTYYIKVTSDTKSETIKIIKK